RGDVQRPGQPGDARDLEDGQVGVEILGEDLGAIRLLLPGAAPEDQRDLRGIGRPRQAAPPQKSTRVDNVVVGRHVAGVAFAFEEEARTCRPQAAACYLDIDGGRLQILQPPGRFVVPYGNDVDHRIV